MYVTNPASRTMSPGIGAAGGTPAAVLAAPAVKARLQLSAGLRLRWRAADAPPCQAEWSQDACGAGEAGRAFEGTAAALAAAAAATAAAFEGTAVGTGIGRNFVRAADSASDMASRERMWRRRGHPGLSQNGYWTIDLLRLGSTIIVDFGNLGRRAGLTTSWAHKGAVRWQTTFSGLFREGSDASEPVVELPPFRAMPYELHGDFVANLARGPKQNMTTKGEGLQNKRAV